MSKIEIIAYYLPQYHPIPENNVWWGKGFTEWTTVGKAKPLFKGHEQPKVPADLGYYDLRLPEVRDMQAELAKEAGISAFCYWHYWFGRGKQLLEMPFNEVLNSGTPDFPFCLGWANESWKAKVWDASAERKDRLLIEQEYLGEEDDIAHFNAFKKAFEDYRYVRHNNRPIFLIYKPLLFDGVKDFIIRWNKLIKKAGIADSFYFIANISSKEEHRICREMGFDSVTYNPISRVTESFNKRGTIYKTTKRIIQHFTSKPIMTFQYESIIDNLFTNEELAEDVIPFILPNWDHSPRSGRFSVILQNCSPDNFRKHVEQVINGIKDKNNKLVFLKSWNEWGEGNYMEPDLKWGKQYINVLGKLVKGNE